MKLKKFFALSHEMARMSLKADAARLHLGYAWWVIEPLLYVAVFYVVFKLILQSPRGDFLPFLMVSKLMFVWFSKSVVNSARSIVTARGLIGKIDLPKALFPMASVQESLYKQVCVVALLVAYLLLNGYSISYAWLCLPAVLFVNYLLIASVSMAAATLVCMISDVAMLVPLAMTFLLFTSGVFWDPRSIGDPEIMELLFLFNPIAFLLDSYRQILMFGRLPDLAHLFALGVASLGSVIAVAAIMRRSSRYLALRAITA